MEWPSEQFPLNPSSSSLGESVASVSHEYPNNLNRMSSWLQNVDDPRSEKSRLTERVHHGQ